MLAATVLALGASADANAKPAALFGFSDSAFERGYPAREVLPLLDRTGASVYRMDIRWDFVEPQPGAWGWEDYDRRYRELRAGGVRPLAVLRSAPAWARKGGSLSGAVLDHGEGPPAPEHLPAWRVFARNVASRYPDLAGVEIFNEPNYAINNWRPQADPRYYTTVLRSANAAVKSVRPRMPVVFGGLLAVSDNELAGNMSAERFLTEAYAAGARGEMDAIAIHPYSYLYPGPPADPRSPYRRMLAGLRRVRNGAGDRTTPFWITETGYHTGAPTAHGVSPETQATRLVETLRLALADSDVDVVLLYALIDKGEDPHEVEDGFGVVRTDLTAKPALAAIAALTGVPRIDLSPARQRLRAARGRRLTVELATSEAAHVTITVRRVRRGPRRDETVRRFERAVSAGRHRLHPFARRGRRRAIRRGLYLVSAQATDGTGERSVVRRARIRVVR